MTDELAAFAKAMTLDGLLIGSDEPNALVQAHNDWNLGHLLALARMSHQAGGPKPGSDLTAETLYESLQDSFSFAAKGVFTLADILDALLAQDPDRERAPSPYEGYIPEGYRETVDAALEAFVQEQPWRANGSIQDVTLPYTEGDEPESVRLARELELA